MCIIHKGFSGFRVLSPASILVRNLIGLESAIPYEIIHSPLPTSLRKRNDSGNFAVRKKRYNEQPTHKTAHSQAPTHKPMLQLAKEQFSCRRTRGNWYICVY